MKIYTKVKDLQKDLMAYSKFGKSIGFVPTMGYLHEGHQKLLNEARKENDIVVLSIFVNPLQFGPNEDLDTYPRDFARDEQVAKASGVDYIFYPSVEEMYPKTPCVKVFVTGKSDVLCGSKRPGHFDGVVTVVTKLFHIVQPTRAYFGLKDAQQAAIIDSLVADFNFPIEIVKVDIVRESDGLAKSSRNVYLTEEERQEAPLIYKGLKQLKESVAKGQMNPFDLKQALCTFYETNLHGQIDYVEILSYPDLKPISTLIGQTALVAVAYKYSKARLIDNVLIQGGKETK
ncbi:MAG: pantoate--beta-alanine ligase [Bacillales bacterium]|nr:pantoate--beta-alanine ligase [Bacillales bacterium]